MADVCIAYIAVFIPMYGFLVRPAGWSSRWSNGEINFFLIEINCLLSSGMCIQLYFSTLINKNWQISFDLVTDVHLLLINNQYMNLLWLKECINFEFKFNPPKIQISQKNINRYECDLKKKRIKKNKVLILDSSYMFYQSIRLYKIHHGNFVFALPFVLGRNNLY